MVLDVESLPYGKPYNIGYIIADKGGNIHKQDNVAILANISKVSAPALRILADTDKPRKERKFHLLTNKGFERQFFKDLKDFNVDTIYTFTNFDKARLSTLFDIPIKFIDIRPMILNVLPDRYIKFCFKHNFLTSKGNIKTDAETIYRYLTKNPNFKEEHIGLPDAEIEFEMLMKVIKWKKKSGKKSYADLMKRA